MRKIQTSSGDGSLEKESHEEKTLGILKNAQILKDKLEKIENSINIVLISNLSHHQAANIYYSSLNYEQILKNYRDLNEQINNQIGVYKKTLVKLSDEYEKLEILAIGNQIAQRKSDGIIFHLRSKKRKRRMAVQICKNWKCPYQHCDKIYGCDISLNLHIKIKHNGGNKSDREKLAMKICQAQISQLPPPKMQYNLPPGFLQDFRRQFLGMNKSALSLE